MLFRVFAPDVKRECVPNQVTVTNEIERGVEMMGHGVPVSSTNTPLIHALVETRRVAEARGDGGGRVGS
ncbi:BnaC03g75890D [Brassica napus]|uniref:BnaC03g75890D protein n=1 Tax=Brassica napus TaxID=3708 RepID=A0A078K407_BRANA|nr:BnaC03g75890D [Brassica napus]